MDLGRELLAPLVNAISSSAGTVDGLKSGSIDRYHIKHHTFSPICPVCIFYVCIM